MSRFNGFRYYRVVLYTGKMIDILTPDDHAQSTMTDEELCAHPLNGYFGVDLQVLARKVDEDKVQRLVLEVSSDGRQGWQKLKEYAFR